MVQHIFIVGAKGLGNYGGYESFLNKLTEYHEKDKEIKYHIACKKNGIGAMDERKLDGARMISKNEFIYHNAHCFKIETPEIGSAQAILYDMKAIQYCCKYIEKQNIEHPIVYVLSSRIGPAMGYFARKIGRLGGLYYQNPDGCESLRKKYNIFVREYWNLSERYMVKHADLVICDSKNIQKIITRKYEKYKCRTTYIAYGAEMRKSILQDDSLQYINWMKKQKLRNKNYYLVVGRFVPENNFETMIGEFMQSNTDKDFALITNVNDAFLKKLERKLHFRKDKRIKFVGTVYDQELLMKIRENAYGYFHGHEVGGTNPSLLEALSSTNLNLLYDIGFNHEVAEDAALYWSKDQGSLSALIDYADQLSAEEIQKLGNKAKQRILNGYTWKKISDQYRKVWSGVSKGNGMEGRST